MVTPRSETTLLIGVWLVIPIAATVGECEATPHRYFAGPEKVEAGYRVVLGMDPPKLRCNAASTAVHGDGDGLFAIVLLTDLGLCGASRPLG